MNVGYGYSIWMMTDGELRRKADKIIQDLSSRFSVASFKSHVTLVGDATADKYFECIFVLAGKTRELMGANSMAHKLFGLTRD